MVAHFICQMAYLTSYGLSKEILAQVKDGWGPLCQFLGLPVPDTSFPNVNDTEAMRRGIRMLKVGVSSGDQALPKGSQSISLQIMIINQPGSLSTGTVTRS